MTEKMGRTLFPGVDVEIAGTNDVGEARAMIRAVAAVRAARAVNSIAVLVILPSEKSCVVGDLMFTRQVMGAADRRALHTMIGQDVRNEYEELKKKEPVVGKRPTYWSRNDSLGEDLGNLGADRKFAVQEIANDIDAFFEECDEGATYTITVGRVDLTEEEEAAIPEV